jgi:hypothetical protein
MRSGRDGYRGRSEAAARGLRKTKRSCRGPDDLHDQAVPTGNDLSRLLPRDIGGLITITGYGDQLAGSLRRWVAAEVRGPPLVDRLDDEGPGGLGLDAHLAYELDAAVNCDRRHGQGDPRGASLAFP